MSEEIVKRISNQEIWVAKNKTYRIDGNIIFAIAEGEQTDEIAQMQYDVNFELAKPVNGKVHFLIDLNKAGKSSPGARSIWKKVSEDDRTGKVALFGLHPVARVLAAFVIGVVSKNEMRFFKTKEDALSWLKQTNEVS